MLDKSFLNERLEHCKLQDFPLVGCLVLGNRVDHRVRSIVHQLQEATAFPYLMLFPSNFDLTQLKLFRLPDFNNKDQFWKEEWSTEQYEIAENPSGYASALHTLTQLDDGSETNAINVSTQKFAIQKLQSCAMRVREQLEYNPTTFASRDLSSISYICRLLDTMDLPSDTFSHQKSQASFLCALQQILRCTELIEKVYSHGS